MGSKRSAFLRWKLDVTKCYAFGRLEQCPGRSGLGSLRDLVFPQEGDYGLAIGAESSPDGAAPVVDRQVTLGSGRCCQHIGDGDGAPVIGQMDRRPFSFCAPKLHVHALDLAARKLFFNVEIQAKQTEHNADRLALVVESLHGEGVHDVLQDEPRAAYRVDVHFVKGGANGVFVHSEDSLARDFSGCGRVGESWPDES